MELARRIAATQQRYDNDGTSAGGGWTEPLVGPTACGPTSPDTYVANWRGLAGRATAEANYGNNGNVPITEAPPVPPIYGGVSASADDGGNTTMTVGDPPCQPSGAYIGYQISIPSDSGYVGTVTDSEITGGF